MGMFTHQRNNGLYCKTGHVQRSWPSKMPTWNSIELCVHMCIYIYNIYIYLDLCSRERKRERERERNKNIGRCCSHDFPPENSAVSWSEPVTALSLRRLLHSLHSIGSTSEPGGSRFLFLEDPEKKTIWIYRWLIHMAKSYWSHGHWIKMVIFHMLC